MQFENNLSLLKKKILLLKAIFFDVDGILTLRHRDLQPSFSTEPIFSEDQSALLDLKNLGLTVGIISSGEHKKAKLLLQELGIEYLYFKYPNKIKAIEEVCATLNYQMHQVAHMGDGPADASVFSYVGLAITVPEADKAVIQKSHYCTQRSGGWGAVREISNLILYYHKECH